MAIILDVALVLIFVLAIWIGYRRGFIKTIAGVAAFVVALVVASMLAAPLAAWSYDTVIEPPIRTAVEEQITAAGANIIEQVHAAYEAMPAVVQNLLAQAGIADAEALNEYVASSASVNPAYRVMDVIRPVVLPLVEVVCSLLLFIVTSIVAGLLLKVLDVVAKLPLLKQLNKSLGLLGGVLSGLMWVLLVVTLLQIVAAFGAPGSAVSLATIDNTILISRVAAINPLAGTLLELIK